MCAADYNPKQIGVQRGGEAKDGWRKKRREGDGGGGEEECSVECSVWTSTSGNFCTKHRQVTVKDCLPLVLCM